MSNEVAKGRASGGALTRGSVASLLEQHATEIAKALPKGMTIERLSKVLLFSIDANPDLLKCTQVSLLRAIKECVTLGLEPGGIRGLAYLIPYKVKGADLGRECTLIVGYKGLRELAMRSGMVRQLEARVVHRNDRFTVRFGLEPILMHEPAIEDPGTPLAVYCLARLADGQAHVEVMTMAEIAAIKARSRASHDGPWVNDFEQMARKTVIRRAMNYMSLSPEVADALASDGDTVDGVVMSREASFAPAVAAVAAPQRETLPAPRVPLMHTQRDETPVLNTYVETPEERRKIRIVDVEDDVSKEVRLIREAIAEAAQKAELDALVPRIKALPPGDADAVRPEFSAKSAALRGAP